MDGGRQRILIAGAGGSGSAFGGFLRRAGHDVTLLGRAAHLAAIERDGLLIDGLWGEHLITGLHLAADAAEVRGPFDAILVTVKAYDTEAIARSIRPFVSSTTVVISLQNGLGNADVLAAEVGDRVLAGRVIFGTEIVAPGHLRITVYADPVLVGAWSNPQLVSLAHAWAERFAAAGIPSEFCADVRTALWGKLLYNTALNPLSALLAVHYGALAEHTETRAIMDQVIAETFAVGIADGARFQWRSAADYRGVFYDRLVPVTYDHRSSMLQDLERGRRTEIESINGDVWQRGLRHGIATPFNELLTRLVRAREGLRRWCAMRLTITKASLEAMHAHARETYPDECCGIVIERNGSEEVVRVTNIQNELHAQDPKQFPRTAQIAYTMGREAAPVLLGAERGDLKLRAFYHSHPDHDAYFSAEDRKQALGGWDEPNYPQAAQIVISVRAAKVRATKAFAWDAAVRDYVPVELKVEDACDRSKEK